MSAAERRLRIHRARQEFIDSLARALVAHNPSDDEPEMQEALHDARILVGFIDPIDELGQ